MAFTYTKIKYYKANLIYDFGRTEDIPTGLYAGVTAGYEHSEFENFGYLGMEYHYSHFNKQSERYYSVEAMVGSYVNDEGFERGFINFKAGHISNLISIGNYRFRFYNAVNYIRGIRRYPTDYLYMQEGDIRGFHSDSLRGNPKTVGLVGNDLFFPVYQERVPDVRYGFCGCGSYCQRQSFIDQVEDLLGIGGRVEYP